MTSSAGSSLSLIKAVLDLVADRRTGVLDVRSDDLRTQIYFDDGKPLFAEDDAPGETFGRLLMRQGVITNDQFVKVIDEMTRAAAGNNQLRFGEVGVALGVLTNEQVERGLAEQVCGIITRSLQRTESTWTFELAPTAGKPPRAFSLEINPAILAALQQSTDSARVADVVAARPDELVVVTGPRPAPAAEVREGGAGGAAAETHTARITAEQAFQKGLALLRDTKTASAALELRRASDLQPESLEYLLYATWAKARSYREIPTEDDQKSLLEIAQRAKHRDPMFAFASYVIGQLSMWAGDEATAKKFFYEALRLDPASEAGKQVRILARRRVGAAAPAVDPASGPAKQDASPKAAAAAPAEQPPARTGKPPAPAAAAPPKAPAHADDGAGTPWPARIVLAAALVATAFAIGVIVRRSAPRAEVTPAASSPPAPSVDAALSADSESKEALAPAGKPPETATDKARDDDQMGTVVLPARAAGHRIFVDGRRAKMDVDETSERSDGIAPLRLRCGPHTIQIGSGGTQEAIDIPCGGRVQLE